MKPGAPLGRTPMGDLRCVSRQRDFHRGRGREAVGGVETELRRKWSRGWNKV